MSRDRPNWMPFSGSVSKGKILRRFSQNCAFCQSIESLITSWQRVIGTDSATGFPHRQSYKPNSFYPGTV